MSELGKQESSNVEDKSEQIESGNDIDQSITNEAIKSKKYGSVTEVAAQYKDLPPPKFIFMGITDVMAITILVGMSKAGKTSIAENLMYHLLNNSKYYIGIPIDGSSINRIFYLNLEEVNRTNSQNLFKLGKEYISDGFDPGILDNLIIKNLDKLDLITTSDFDELISWVKETNSDLLVIDSISKLYDGKIEESHIAKKLFKKLTRVLHALQIPIILLHHTTKLKENQPLTRYNISGSRILQQEIANIIGVGTSGSRRYLKAIDFRNAPVDEKVTYFKIGENRKITLEGAVSSIMHEKSNDGRSATAKYQITLQYIKDNPGKTKSDIVTEVVDTCNIARSTAYDHFKKIESEIKIIDNKYYSIEYKEPSEPEVTVQTTTTTVKINKCRYGCIDNIDDKDI